jgi:hypothetical protein
MRPVLTAWVAQVPECAPHQAHLRITNKNTRNEALHMQSTTHAPLLHSQSSRQLEAPCGSEQRAPTLASLGAARAA